jgi:Alpha/beta hydrolase domain
VFSSQPADALNGSPVFDLASVGYTQSEFFVEGTANAYSPTSALTTDGHWTVQPSSQAAYKTRVVVNRPVEARDFNGTVVVEWLNVSGGADASPDWGHTHVELIRRGYAWVGVSAQAVGVNQLKCPDPPLPTCPGSVAGPRPGDAPRYGSLNHPGDSYSYDMFSQAGQAIRDNAQLVLGGLHPQRLLAVGESQSAGRMVTYINAVHPLAEVYDGFLVHSRGAGSAALTQAPLPTVPTPVPSLIRDDLVPVLFFQTETDVAGAIGAAGLAARQPDSALFRLWEVAGTAHTSAVDAPVATLGGLGQTGSPFCSAFGTTTPFTQQQLDALYRNHGKFVTAWSTATLKALFAGFLRPEDSVNLLVVGAQSEIPSTAG